MKIEEECGEEGSASDNDAIEGGQKRRSPQVSWRKLRCEYHPSNFTRLHHPPHPN